MHSVARSHASITSPVRRFFLCLLLVFSAAVPALAQSPNLLPMEEAFRISVTRESAERLQFRWQIADDYYMYREFLEARNAADGTALTLDTVPGIVEENDANFGVSEVYYGSAVARVNVDGLARIAITYQGCKKDSICYPPVTQMVDTASLHLSEAVVGYSIEAVETAASENGGAGFAIAEEVRGGGMISSLLASGGAVWVVLSFLAFGVLLAFTPCVLPMYPILSATLAREGEALTARRGFALSSAYVFAMAVAFGLLGLVAAWSGQNLQVVLQSPYAVGAVAVVFVILATSMFGLFELQLPSAWVNRIAATGNGRRGSLGGAAAIGFLSALIVGPCVTAPLAAGLLYIAQTGDAALGAAALFALGFGQGIPLILLGTMGSRALPKAGAWMVQVKYVFGFVFLGAAIWMAERILPGQITLALWAALLLAAAVFIGLFEPMTRDASVLARFRKAAGLALSLAAVLLAVGAATGGTDPLRPLGHIARGGPSSDIAPKATFTTVSTPEALSTALAASAGRPSLIYFTADWCVTCRAVERDVLPAADVAARLMNFQRIEVDLSTLDDGRQALMRALAVAGPPTMVFFDADAKEAAGTRLVGEVTVTGMTDAMDRAAGQVASR